VTESPGTHSVREGVAGYPLAGVAFAGGGGDVSPKKTVGRRTFALLGRRT
jgi:hypothetical protein